MDVHQKLRPRCTKGGSRVSILISYSSCGETGIIHIVSHSLSKRGHPGYVRWLRRLPHINTMVCYAMHQVLWIMSLSWGHRLSDTCWCRSSAPERDEADEPWPQRTLDSCSTMQLRDVLLLKTIRHSGSARVSESLASAGLPHWWLEAQRK
jgi:hypothetical protein